MRPRSFLMVIALGVRDLLDPVLFAARAAGADRGVLDERDRDPHRRQSSAGGCGRRGKPHRIRPAGACLAKRDGSSLGGHGGRRHAAGAGRSGNCSANPSRNAARATGVGDCRRIHDSGRRRRRSRGHGAHERGKPGGQQELAFLAASPPPAVAPRSSIPNRGPVLIDLTGALEEQPHARLRAPCAEPAASIRPLQLTPPRPRVTPRFR